jgi:hypothetical protein
MAATALPYSLVVATSLPFRWHLHWLTVAATAFPLRWLAAMSFWRMAAAALPYPKVAATALPLRHLFFLCVWLVAYGRNCVAISTVAATALPLAPDLPFAVRAARIGSGSSGEREGEGSSDGLRVPALLLGRIFLPLPVMEACAVTWNQLDVPCSAVFLDQGRRCPGRRPSTHEPLRSRPERNLSAAINASAGSE